MRDGVHDIPIEQRNPAEVTIMSGLHSSGVLDVQITPDGSPVANYGFDVTPARLVSGLITERGICAANEASILGMYPEKNSNE